MELTKENILKEFNRLAGGYCGVFLKFISIYDNENKDHKKYMNYTIIDNINHKLCEVYEDGSYKYYCIEVSPGRYGETLLMQTRSNLLETDD